MVNVAVTSHRGRRLSSLSQHRPLISRQAEAHRHRTVPQARLIACRDSRDAKMTSSLKKGPFAARSFARSLARTQTRSRKSVDIVPTRQRRVERDRNTERGISFGVSFTQQSSAIITHTLLHTVKIGIVRIFILFLVTTQWPHGVASLTHANDTFVGGTIISDKMRQSVLRERKG